MIEYIKNKLKNLKLWFKDRTMLIEVIKKQNTKLLNRKMKNVLELQMPKESLKQFKQRIQKEVDKL